VPAVQSCLLILNKCGLTAKTCYLFYSAYGFNLLV
jgi:hypothetical protein